MRARPGDEVGSLFRCVVATHVAVHGLLSHSLDGLDTPPSVHPVRLDLETEDPIDDIRVEFSDGRRGFVRAKRKLSKGRPMEETVAGWARQVPSTGPDDLLVVAAKDFVGPTKHLARALRRLRSGLPVFGDEQRAIATVSDLISDPDVARTVLQRARVLSLPNSTTQAKPSSYLSALMDLCVANTEGERAVSALHAYFHRLAGQALGSTIADWVSELENHGLTVIADESGPRVCG